MNSFLQHKWSWSGLMLALAAVFILVPTSTSLAHPNEQGASIQSNETKLDAAYFSNNGTLDGLIVTDNGLAVADGSSTGFYTSAEIETSLQSVSDIVPLWKADLADDNGLVVETRLRTDGGAWSAWEANPYAYYPVRNDEYSGNIIWVGGQKVALQLRVTLSKGSTLENLTLFVNDASDGPTDGEIAVQMAGVEIASADSCPVGPPAIVSRTMWGNPKGQNSQLAPKYAPVTHIVVHHSETPLSEDYAAIVRSIWNFHTNILWWGDVGYNYMIDPNGVVYEGRAGAHAADGSYTRNDADGDVIGIHDGLNKNSMSIGLLGCYGECDDPRLTVSEPTDAMRDSAVNLMAWKLDARQIDPASSATYNGLANIPAIAGGKDVSMTTSPGPNIYNKLPNWRERVGERTPCQQASLQLSPQQLAFTAEVGGDNPVSQAVTISISGTGSIDWTAEKTGSADWLDVSPTSGTATADTSDMLTVEVDITDLAKGQYTGIITVKDDQNNLHTVDVTLTLTDGNNGGGELLACQIVDIAFDEVQYTVGDTINLRVRLADADDNPLAGANIDVTVDKTVAAQSFNEIPFLDKTGVYEGSFKNTDVAGSYRFSFRASDPTGQRFLPCTGEKTVTVDGKQEPVVPMITSCEPNTGDNSVARTITCTGTNFVDGLNGTFNDGTNLNASFVSETSFTATVPAGITAGTYDLTATNPDQQSGTLNDAYTATAVIDAPTITSCEPNTGDNSVARTITCTGTNFVDGLNGTFNDGTNLNASFVSETSFTATVPAGTAIGTYNLTVTNPDNQSDTLNDAYTVTAPSVSLPDNSMRFNPVCVEGGAMTLELVNGVDIRGIELEIAFDPNAGQVGSITPNSAFELTPINEIDNSNGLIKFAGTVFADNTLNGTADLLTINWSSITGGPSQVRVQNVTFIDDNDVRISVAAGTVEPGVISTDCAKKPSGQANSLSFSPVCVSDGDMALQVTNAADIRGIDLEISFDANVGQVGSITPNSAFEVIAVNDIDNSDGVIKFAGTVFGDNTLNGTADLLTINWSSISNGPAQVRVQNVTLVDDNDVKISVAAGTVDTGFISRDCAGVVGGVVVLQGKSDYSGVTVTTAGGQQIQTNARGEFTFINDTVVSVSYPGYLSGEATRSTGVEIAAQGSTVRRVGSMTLLAGDINSDNTVNIFDMTYIASRFNASDASGDLTGDGLINIFDLSLAAGNYNAQGPLTEWQ